MKKQMTFALLAIAISVSGQIKKTIPEMTVSSPEIASLGKYGEMDVDHYTGAANIQVPLYTITFGGVQIPIGLSYNTSGIKVEQEATWVGLGWNLSAQPTINRQINGLSDINEGNNMASELTGYPYTTLAFPEYAYGVSDELKNTLISSTKNFFDYNIKQGTNSYDTQPDVFSVNLFGESVKFVLTQKAFNNGVIEGRSLNPDHRLKIAFDEQTKNFTITNDRGFVFYFDVKEYSVTGTATANDSEDSTFFLGMGVPGQSTVRVIPGYDQKIISGWHVSKVVSPTNEIINFNYSNRTFIDDHPKAIWSQQVMACALTHYQSGDVNPQRSKVFQGFLTQHDIVYLNSITTDKEEVFFITSGRNDLIKAGTAPYYTVYGYVMGGSEENPKKLDAVLIKNKAGETIKNYAFNYTYFNSTNNNVINNWNPKAYLRLKLDAITFNSEFYRSFTYINTESLPSKLSKDQDHWGYYNGKNNASRIPTNKLNTYCAADFPDKQYPLEKVIRFTGADKDANFTFGKNGLLQKVYYPTKGYTALEYEGNSIVVDRSPVGDRYPLVDYETMEITSKFVSSPVSSPVIHLTNRFTEPGILTFSCGSEFMQVPANTLSWRKCDVLQADVDKPALQMINADTGAIVFTKIFSSDVNCSAGHFCPPLSVPNGIISFPILLQGIPEGNYYFRVRASHEPSNALDEEEGVYSGTGNPDYFKPYYFAVRFTLKIPKDALYEHYNKQVGGARVESISNYNHNNTLIDKKKFKYEKLFSETGGGNFYSSGILMNDLVYHNYQITHNHWTGLNPLGTMVDPSCLATAYVSIIKYVYFNSTPQTRNPETAKGSHIGYSRVEEITLSNQNTQTNGKVVFEFANRKNFHLQDLAHGGQTYIFPGFLDNPSFSQNYAQYPMETYEHLNGDLIKKEIFNSFGSRLKKIDYKYIYHDYYPTLNIGIYGGVIKNYGVNFYYCGGSYQKTTYLPFDFQPYKIKNEISPTVEISEVDYFSSGEISKITNYEYNEKYSIKKITEQGSGMDNKIIENLYASDAEASSFPLASTLVSKNIINTPLQSKDYTNGELTAKTESVFSNFNNNTFVAISKIKSAKGSGASNDIVEYQKYDEKGNVLQFKKASSPSTVLIWGYKKTVPVAKIENLDYASIPASIITEIQSKSDAGNEQELLTALNSLRGLFPDAMFTTFTHKPLIGISTVTDAKGDVVRYHYDLQGRLQYVKDKDGNILNENLYHFKG